MYLLGMGTLVVLRLGLAMVVRLDESPPVFSLHNKYVPAVYLNNNYVMLYYV